jgi:hypothetical protein
MPSANSLMVAFTNPGRPQRNGAATAGHPLPGDLRQALDAINHDNWPAHQDGPTQMAIELDDAETRMVRRTTTPVRNIKADRPRTAPSVS